MMLSTETKMVGGEQEIENEGLFYGVTNSGRSSLRWAIRSMSLQRQKVLVPDFVCQIVVDVLLEFDIEVQFYQVREDFEFELPNELGSVSAIYLVKYFGHESHSFDKLIKNTDTPLIIDDVFGIEAPKIPAEVPWCYFNSLRKITAVADFSQLVSSTPLKELRKERLPNFSTLKYKAKSAKSQYLNASVGKESDYLPLFSNAESLLDECSGVYEPEDRSVFLACQFSLNYRNEQKARVENLGVAKATLDSEQFIDINANFPSFLPLLLMNRDRVRKALMGHSIFLAVHWPKIRQAPSLLCDTILSLPLDSRYTAEDIKRICDLIKKLDK
ncbi:pyridoxal phosphate-dependent transferase [Vibrio splendidus]|uniref:pyridoxal phosphate-dependent transferase n=1 Tax=Vibrio splendidus TaxID=29497 RepID=UPI00148BAE05|nr:pyridoxal phosphate-dependent transferase [Vibrio splendidus]NOI91186.1 pyridoxal phosphate-dependent transferase [Vibrio splendidus]